MAPFPAFLVVGLLITSAYANQPAAQKNTTTPTTTIKPTGTAVIKSSTSTQITASKAVSTVTTPSVHPNATSAPIQPTRTIPPIPTHTPTAIPTTQPKNGTTMPPTSTSNPTSNPTTNGICPKSKSVAREARAKWVAVAFAILFGVTTVVMTVLYCRQRKIYRELEGDSSLSRLI